MVFDRWRTVSLSTNPIIGCDSQLRIQMEIKKLGCTACVTKCVDDGEGSDRTVRSISVLVICYQSGIPWLTLSSGKPFFAE